MSTLSDICEDLAKRAQSARLEADRQKARGDVALFHYCIGRAEAYENVQAVISQDYYLEAAE